MALWLNGFLAFLVQMAAITLKVTTTVYYRPLLYQVPIIMENPTILR